MYQSYVVIQQDFVHQAWVSELQADNLCNRLHEDKRAVDEWHSHHAQGSGGSLSREACESVHSGRFFNVLLRVEGNSLSQWIVVLVDSCYRVANEVTCM